MTVSSLSAPLEELHLPFSELFSESSIPVAQNLFLTLPKLAAENGNEIPVVQGTIHNCLPFRG